MDIISKGYDIIAITETHLDISINSAKIFSSEYTVYRRDRDRNGGGVLIAVKNIDETNVELLMLRIHYSKNKSFVFAVFYRSPSSDAEYLEQFQTNITHFNKIPTLYLLAILISKKLTGTTT